VSVPQRESSESTSAPTSFPRKSQLKFDRDLVGVIETNVDDVTGEVLSRTIERLLAEGADDASATPYLGKKGRAGFTVRVVCRTDSVKKLAQVLVEETGTLGVKITKYTRLIVPRRVISVPFAIEGFRGNVSVKVADFKGRILRIKPELSEARQICESQKIPLRDVLEQISKTARDFLREKPDVLSGDSKSPNIPK
jgi:pyridinium-3,5-bisthiocarboxylic acid mononucleotide nickel chelatase